MSLICPYRSGGKVIGNNGGSGIIAISGFQANQIIPSISVQLKTAGANLSATAAIGLLWFERDPVNSGTTLTDGTIYAIGSADMAHLYATSINLTSAFDNSASPVQCYAWTKASLTRMKADSSGKIYVVPLVYSTGTITFTATGQTIYVEVDGLI